MTTLTLNQIVQEILEGNTTQNKIHLLISELEKIKKVNIDYEYKPSTSDEIKGNEKALKYLKEIKTLQDKGTITVINPLELNSSIERINFILQLNESLNTGGKPSTLTVGEVATLVQLYKVFTDTFPEMSSQLTEETILNKIGVTLIGKEF